MNTQSSRLCLVLCVLLFSPINTPAEVPAADANLKFFQDLSETNMYTNGRPWKVQPTPDGNFVIFLRSGPRDLILQLFELDVKTGKEEKLLSPDDILKGAKEKLSIEERARRERMPITNQGFTHFDLSRDGKQVLVMLSGQLYVMDRTTRNITSLRGEDWLDPSFSPDGRHVAAVRDGELFVIDLATQKAHQITTGANDTLIHGLPEFIAQEEMERDHGYWWSPDSSAIAYQETDDSDVEVRYVFNPLTPQEPPVAFRYPRAGTANARVRLGIISRDGGATTWVHWDAAKYPYLARAAWSESGPLTILVQTREQQEEKLLLVDPRSGECKELLAESDPAWLNLDPNPEIPFWLKDGKRFLWTTERSGWWQLELRSIEGKIRDLTPAGCECTDLIDVDEASGTITTSGGADPRQRQLYSVRFDGSQPTKLDARPGIHKAVFSRNHQVYVHGFELQENTFATEVRSRDGKVLAKIRSVAEEPPLQPPVDLPQVGERNFYAAILRPRDFQPGKKYPVILSEYTGPTGTVVFTVPRFYLEDQWLADQGFIVVSLDGRGTPGRGREWERVIRGSLIHVQLEDQVAGLQALAAKYPEMDMTRVGVYGWSFGGYFAAMATAQRPDIFRCAVAGAPVVDWEDYDTHYTERYLGLPSKNKEAYKASNVLTYAAGLQRPLLIIHGMTDDNVYFQHSMKLTEALFAAGKNFELLPLLGTHLVPDPVVKLRMQARIADFLRRNL